MKKRTFATSSLVCQVMLVTSLAALFGLAPTLSYSQEQDLEVTAPPIGVTNSNLNPLQIALLHWYDANQATSIAVGKSMGFEGPESVAFDGANIWVSNQQDNTVTKLQASDGTNLGTFAAGAFPQGVAFDGANIWVANNGGIVTKLRASDGVSLGTFAVGRQPAGVAFDGAHIWVLSAIDSIISKL